MSGSWDPNNELWDLKLLRNGEEEYVTCSYVVFATGAGSQVPVAPVYENEVRPSPPLVATFIH
jgi:cation diffusion facilitator CzcD-associated flavoprotein CzcO